MAISATTIASSIAALSVSGVTIKDLDAIPEQVAARATPVLYPKPDGFMSNLAVTRQSQGIGAAAQRDVSYTLTYRYLHAPIGEGRGLFDVYQAAITNITAILDALIANDNLSGAIDITPAGVVNVGPVADPSGEWFHGCDLTFKVLEFED